MGLRDTLLGVGRTAAGLFGEALIDWADGRFQKAAPQTNHEADPSDENSENAPGGDEQESAASDPVPDEKADRDPKALFSDPFAVIEQLGYKEKPSAVTYNTLKLIMWRMPIIQAIIQTRINQVAAFAKPQHDRYQLGFRVQLREQDREPTGLDKQWAKQMETLLLRTGVTDNPRGRDNFETFLRKITWDSMVFDQATFELVPNRLGQPAEWYAVDASTVRLADTVRTFMDEDLTDVVRYVQIYDSMIVAEYTQEELAFGVRNPRTDLRVHGYGTSELEILINVISALLNTWEYNARFFTQGSAAKGLLNFKGAISGEALRQFRRHWYQMIAGVENAWKTPITNAEDVQWLSMQSSNRDMEYNAWFDFLIKVGCSVYSMDPIEVNFKYGNTGQRQGMNEQNNKEKITESRERGLRPLLGFLQHLINRNIIWPINENFEFAFVGLDAFTKDKAADLQEKQVKTYRTVDELRAEEDLPPLPNGLGEVILDPVWLQHASAQQQMAAMGGAVPGDPSADPNTAAALGVENAEVPDTSALLGEDTTPQPPTPSGPMFKSQRARGLQEARRVRVNIQI